MVLKIRHSCSAKTSERELKITLPLECNSKERLRVKGNKSQNSAAE